MAPDERDPQAEGSTDGSATSADGGEPAAAPSDSQTPSVGRESADEGAEEGAAPLVTEPKDHATDPDPSIHSGSDVESVERDRGDRPEPAVTDTAHEFDADPEPEPEAIPVGETGAQAEQRMIRDRERRDAWAKRNIPF